MAAGDQWWCGVIRWQVRREADCQHEQGGGWRWQARGAPGQPPGPVCGAVQTWENSRQGTNRLVTSFTPVSVTVCLRTVSILIWPGASSGRCLLCYSTLIIAWQIIDCILTAAPSSQSDRNWFVASIIFIPSGQLGWVTGPGHISSPITNNCSPNLLVNFSDSFTVTQSFYQQLCGNKDQEFFNGILNLISNTDNLGSFNTISANLVFNLKEVPFWNIYYFLASIL